MRDECNSAFDFFDNGERRGGGDRAANFGSGGSGGGGGGSDRRNSPGFVGFDRNRDYRDGNYPDYDVAIGRPPAGGGRPGTRRSGNGVRILDNVDFDGGLAAISPTRTDFVNTNG